VSAVDWRPRFHLAPLISRPTLCVHRLPQRHRDSAKLLKLSMQYPDPYFRQASRWFVLQSLLT
jgi:hypothetical protein